MHARVFGSISVSSFTQSHAMQREWQWLVEAIG